ncbi:hypothetical protein DEU34_3035 [Microbacterium sp. AG1240]|uniref:hypothetical protein n=1 Tax=Microbacterium sp. AG1240 TaxID=2183992 RepID=UPI000EAB666D|nr:hypothetical protein [Microbacterium sp. AG1240]RKT31100.1 hypothetical protein DEU34_3035 [Microbacterium sp. AG1240]
MMKIRRRVLAGIPATALAIGILAFAAPAPAQAAQQVSYYSSWNTCSLRMDRLAQQGYTIVQGCTPDSYQNGTPVRWRLIYQ